MSSKLLCRYKRLVNYQTSDQMQLFKTGNTGIFSIALFAQEIYAEVKLRMGIFNYLGEIK